jgi:hypothetical protein
MWSPSVCREIPMSADKMFWAYNKPAKWISYITPYSPAKFKRHFGRTYHFPIQNPKLSQAKYQPKAGSKQSLLET